MLKTVSLPQALAIVLSFGAGVSAQNLNNNNNNNSHGNRASSSSTIIGFVLVAIFLLFFCCGLQRRRVKRASEPAYISPPLVLPLHSTGFGGSQFPSGMQYGGAYPYPQPPQQYNSASEYPPTGPNAELAPPPYVKEGAPLTGYTAVSPPGPPPPGIDAAYPSVYSPPSRAHISVRNLAFRYPLALFSLHLPPPSPVQRFISACPVLFCVLHRAPSLLLLPPSLFPALHST
ncbi:hypothetical protein B0H11DRAFT_2358232 [Mycena galericulata]|nr:hypothetical protein B0H11DRAFT_2358232 [Mycena galericulata]